jgi:LuxR family maltose regulon positive regulatory protein
VGRVRSRITERLSRATRFPVTLIAAPAGFGKSVALRDFLAASRLEAITYNVRREDGTLLSFVRRLSEALEPLAPSAIASFPAMQERIMAADEPVRRLSDWFAEHLRKAVGTVVIDDLHYAATDPASIALLADLIERTGERINWIVAARSDVGLPVATWIAYGRMDLPIGEDDLRFTTDEALAAADIPSERIEPQEIEALRQLTEGWPVALTIALRTRTHSADLRSASSGTREMVYRYLAEQVLSGLSREQRAFVFATSVFSTFDADIAEALGASNEFIHELRSAVAFLNEADPGCYRYHDLFRDFLETELRRSGEREWQAALCRGAKLLEERGSETEALELFVKARASEDAVRIMLHRGVTLFEQGHAAVLSQALEIVPEPVRAGNAALLGLQAMIDASLGRLELAAPNFLAAIDAAQSIDLRMSLLHRYSIELVRSDRDRECVELLEPYALDGSIPAQLRIPLLGTIATAYLYTNRQDEALRAAEEALQLLDASTPTEIRARVFQQASHVQRYAGSTAQSRKYAEIAIDLALQKNLYELAARAYSVVYTIVHDESDDPLASLAVLDKIRECAKKAASPRARVFALIASYDIEVDRGNEDALERLDSEIRENEANSRLITTALLPARALRLTWQPDFEGAYALLAGSGEEQARADQKALRLAEIALYAAAGGFAQESAEAATQANALLSAAEATRRRTIRTRLFLACVDLVRGHEASANRHVMEAERALEPHMRRLRPFVQAVRALHRLGTGQGDDAALAAALEKMRSEHLGGIARMLQTLPLQQTQKVGVALLTSAEREVLQMLVSGASTKSVAATTGRSPHTVDTHIRSICRKFGCSGRREAVALATSQGWVQN